MDDPVHQLEQLYREMGPALLAYFRRQPALAVAAEDLLQDTFVRALQRMDRLRASVSPRAYVYGIARHVGLDALRRRRPTEAGNEQPHLVVPDAGEDARLPLSRCPAVRPPFPVFGPWPNCKRSSVRGLLPPPTRKAVTSCSGIRR